MPVSPFPPATWAMCFSRWACWYSGQEACYHGDDGIRKCKCQLSEVGEHRSVLDEHPGLHGDSLSEGTDRKMNGERIAWIYQSMQVLQYLGKA